MEKICVFTYATKGNQKCLDSFRKSFETYHGWGVCVLGLDPPLPQTQMECYRKALQITKPDRIVVCLDATFRCIRDKDDFLDVFSSFHAPIVVGQESGCIVGYAGELFAMFDWMLQQDGSVASYRNAFPEKLQWDVDNHLVADTIKKNSAYFILPCPHETQTTFYTLTTVMKCIMVVVLWLFLLKLK